MSYKKLQDLLNINSQANNEQWNFLQNKPAPSNSPQFNPLGAGLVSGISRIPSYQSIPGLQSMFYNPSLKTQVDNSCQSPVFQIPTKKSTQIKGSIFQGSRFTAADTNPSNNHSVAEGHNLSSLLLNPIPNQMNGQPSNLEELLQKSFSYIPSNSLAAQSPFASSMHSPSIGGHTFSSHVQARTHENNHLNPRSSFGISLQQNNLIANQNFTNNPANEATHHMLILQLAQILKQESESKIKSAIAELILKYEALGVLSSLSGTEMQELQNLIKLTEIPKSYPYQQEQIPQQSMFSLSPINQANSLNEQAFKFSIQPKKVNAARRELFAMNEIPLMHPQTTPEQTQRLPHQSLFQPNTNPMFVDNFLKGLSPTNGLDKEMTSLTLGADLSQNPYGSLCLTTVSAPEKIEDLANEDLGSILRQKVPSGEDLPGVYNKAERINKILKYKNKIRKWRKQHPVKRIFKGRSMVAVQKPRIKGKFVTPEEYSDYIQLSCKKEYQESMKLEHWN